MRLQQIIIQTTSYGATEHADKVNRALSELKHEVHQIDNQTFLVTSEKHQSVRINYITFITYIVQPQI